MKTFLKHQKYRRHRVRAVAPALALEFVRALLSGILIFIGILFLIAYSAPAQAFPFGKIQKGFRIASAATDLAKKYRIRTPNEGTLPASKAPTACTTDADCCNKNPKICEVSQWR